MRHHFIVILLYVIAATTLACRAGLPTPAVPDGLGVNIHFTGEPTRDLDMIKAAGFGLVRMDFTWEAVEKEKGVYNFVAYDQLTDGLSKRRIRPLYILDYGNKIYEKERSVQTEEGRQAFAGFASEAARHYQGKNVIWELWNEPNLGMFWTPQLNVNAYMALAKTVFPAMRKSDPQAFLVAPATSGVALDFLEACFKQGLLQMVDGITVHPYRQSPPETVADDILRLRALIAKYSPDRTDFPILSGEWGYSGIWGGFNDERQGQYLSRQFLVNLSLGLPLSVWYDWRDDGSDPKEPEHHFGTVTFDYQPKPGYLAMQKLTQSLSGLRFVKRLQSPPEDYLLYFSDGRRDILAAWCTGQPHAVELLPQETRQLTGAVRYLPVPPSATNLLAEGAWTVKPRSIGILCGSGADRLWPEFAVSVRNPFQYKIPVEIKVVAATNLEGSFVGPQSFDLESGKDTSLVWKGPNPGRRDRKDLAVTVEAAVGGVRRQQVIRFVPVNPMVLDVASRREGEAVAVLRLSAGDKVKGRLVSEMGGSNHVLSVELNPAAGTLSVLPLEPAKDQNVRAWSTGDDVLIPLPWKARFPDESIRCRLDEGESLVADSGLCRVVLLDVNTDTAAAVNDGDPKTSGESALNAVPCADPDAPAEKILQLSFEFGAGWKFVRISPVKEQVVEKTPRTMAVWVRGNTSRCRLNMRFTDASGRTFQPTFGVLDFQGWRLLSARLDDPTVSSWGGTGDGGKIVYPIRINTFVLVDGTKAPLKDEVAFAGFHLVYVE